MRIVDVAVKYAFANTDSFSRAFKRITGCMPSEYKRENPNFTFERRTTMRGPLGSEEQSNAKAGQEANLYQLLCSTNYQLAEGREFSESEKLRITDVFLNNVSDRNTVERFHKGVKSPADGRSMYPLFFVPPYNGSKYRLLTGQMPKTHILSANHYELEILRLLAIWRNDEPRVNYMIGITFERLDTTCFAHFCGVGECMGAGISVLRLLSGVKPTNQVWIDELLRKFGDIFTQTGGRSAVYPNFPFYYFVLALSDCGSALGLQLLDTNKEILKGLLYKGWLVGPAVNDTYNPYLKLLIKNALSRLPEFGNLKAARIYISDQDGRCYCEA